MYILNVWIGSVKKKQATSVPTSISLELAERMIISILYQYLRKQITKIIKYKKMLRINAFKTRLALQIVNMQKVLPWLWPGFNAE